MFSIMKNLIQKHFSAVTRNVSLTLSMYPTQRKTKREYYLTLGYDQPAYKEVVQQQQSYMYKCKLYYSRVHGQIHLAAQFTDGVL